MSEETIENEAPEEELDEDVEEETTPAEQTVTTKNKSGKVKWIFLILVIILAISGLGIKFAPDRFSFLTERKFKTPEISVDTDNLREEILSPFFIPPGPADDTIRIDLSIIWDGLAAVRFKKKELNLRNMMYEKFYNMAEQNQDLNEKIPYLENEVSSMLRSSLNVQNQEVKIK